MQASSRPMALARLNFGPGDQRLLAGMLGHGDGITQCGGCLVFIAMLDQQADIDREAAFLSGLGGLNAGHEVDELSRPGGEAMLDVDVQGAGVNSGQDDVARGTKQTGAGDVKGFGETALGEEQLAEAGLGASHAGCCMTMSR